MPHTNRTIARDSIFGTRTTARATPNVERSEDDKARQTAVWLTDGERDWLDSRCRDIRGANRRGVTRSALVRAVTQATRDWPVEAELPGVTDETELAQALRRALRSR